MLWVANYDDLPQDYIELRLCRDVYHCTPSQLDGESWAVIRTHLALMEAERRAKR